MTDSVEARLSRLEQQVQYLAKHAGIALPNFDAIAGSALPSHIQQMISGGDLINAIKAYREMTGCDLATAKKVIDSYR